VKNKKKWLIVLIVAFPSFFWLILETSTINSNKLPFYGPKKVVSQGDTIFHKVTDAFFASHLNADSTFKNAAVDTNQFPIYVLMFIADKYRDDAYRLTGLWEYLNYKKQKINHIPFILITESNAASSAAYEDLKKLGQHQNVHFYTWPKQSYDSLNKTYFSEKPYFIDYSFFVLVDKKRHVRGFYDGRYVSEFKRLIGEYQHLRLKEEKQKLIETNEIKSDS
jgi:hypothetical protein